MKNSTLKIESLHKNFQDGEIIVPILKGISLEFNQGQTYAITGVSGSGKSTFMYLLAGLDKPNQGTIFWNDRNLFSLNETEFSSLLNSLLGIVFQSSFLLKELSVLENVMIKGLISGIAYDQCEEKAFNLLACIKLADTAYKKPTQLSGGQQQRVAVMRALFNEPAFLLADEPTGNLDKKSAQDLIHFLLDCQAQWKMGMIISTHDQYLASKLNHQLVLHDGCFLQLGNPIVQAAFKELS
jgi:lipoprotein-releasing system ATP-binding protein